MPKGLRLDRLLDVESQIISDQAGNTVPGALNLLPVGRSIVTGLQSRIKMLKATDDKRTEVSNCRVNVVKILDDPNLDVKVDVALAPAMDNLVIALKAAHSFLADSTIDNEENTAVCQVRRVNVQSRAEARSSS